MGALEGNRIDHHENQRRLVDTIGPFHRCRTCDQRPPEQGGSVRGRELLTERAKRRFSPAAPQDFAWTLIVLPAVRVELTDLQRNLTRRANHWHVFIIARIEPAPGNRVAGFLNRTAALVHDSAFSPRIIAWVSRTSCRPSLQ
jgi:hypothetical protein